MKYLYWSKCPKGGGFLHPIPNRFGSDGKLPLETVFHHMHGGEEHLKDVIAENDLPVVIADDEKPVLEKQEAEPVVKSQKPKSFTTSTRVDTNPKGGEV